VRVWLPRGLGAAAFVLYAWVAPGGPYWLDWPSDRGRGAVRSAHPSGFRSTSCWRRAAAGGSRFAPTLSAACAALAVVAGAAGRQAARPERGTIDAACVAAATAAAAVGYLVFFRHATVAEVYAPTAALMAWALVCIAGRPGPMAEGWRWRWCAGSSGDTHRSSAPGERSASS
jgi:hypothetical protein